MEKTGRVVKLIAGFYYVKTDDNEIYACHAKGLFRKTGEKPLVGDMVDIEVTDEKDMEGSLINILPRTTSLDRPPIANIDRVIIIQALANPKPRLSLTDKYLVMAEERGIVPIVAFNKLDLVTDGDICACIRDYYRGTGYQVLFFSARTGKGLDEVREALSGHTSCVAGPSGAGKSSLINTLCGTDHMETGDISKKLGRGKQTTRHTELIELDSSTLMSDTPGFGTVSLPNIEPLDLFTYFPEYIDLATECRFSGCAHISEPDCAIRAAVEEGRLSRDRYASYVSFYKELAERNPHKNNRK